MINGNLSGTLFFLISSDKPIKLVFEYFPAAADFFGLDFACGYVLEIGGTGYLEVTAGLPGIQYQVLFSVIHGDICPAVRTVAPVR